MKKKLLCFCVSSLLLFDAFSQQPTEQKNAKQDKGVFLSAGVALPLGDFSSTHLMGITVEVSPSYHKFKSNNSGFSKLALTYSGGIAYYLGKKETVSNHTYKYPGYIFIHGFGGIIYVPTKKIESTLTAGPALGIYNGNTQFNIGAKLDLAYQVNDKIAVGPGIIMMKEFGANSLWSVSVKASIKL